MNGQQKTNELFEAAHLMILISYTFFSIILMSETVVMSWEIWVLPIIILGVSISWGLHIRQSLTEHQRLWIYSILMMVTFFFYGIPGDRGQLRRRNLRAVVSGYLREACSGHPGGYI